MAELDFKHNVKPIPAAEEVKTLDRSVKAETHQIPDYQGAASNYAAATNWMSNLGSYVATQASNAIASKLGAEYGKNPKGDLGVPITDFDKTMQESYKTQAQATLGLQASKLITDSNLELAKAPRITPELIAKNSQSVQLGLKNIFDNAPSELRPHLEYQYGNLMISQMEHLSSRMLHEGKEDLKNNVELSSAQLAENAHSFAMSDKDTAAENAVENVRKQNESLVQQKLITPLEAKNRVDSARQSMQAGKYQRKYDLLNKPGEREQFLRSLETRPKDISDADYPYLLNSVMRHADQTARLESQDQSLKIANFQLLARTNPDQAANALPDLQNSLTAKQYADTEIWFNKLNNKLEKSNQTFANVTASWGDYNKFPSDFTDKQKLDTLEHNAAILSQQKNISQTEAEMQLAATAAGPIAGYNHKIEAKATSGNSAQMDEAAASVDYINASDKPQNLFGMSDSAKAMLRQYKAFRDTHDPVTAAQMAKEAVIGKSEQQRKANDESFQQHYIDNKKSGDTKNSFALRVADVPKDRMVNVPQLSDFIDAKYEGYYKLFNGDNAMAIKSVKEDLDMTFGDESVNGFKQYTQFPIIKTFNLPENSEGFIHDDLASQLTDKFQNSKTFYDNGAVDSWWEVKPNVSLNDYFTAVHKINELSSNKNILDLVKSNHEIKKYRDIVESFHNSPPPKLIQHHRDGSINQYDSVIVANPLMSRNKNGEVIGSYDVNIKTPTSVTSIAYQDPTVGPMRYTPNRDKIISGNNYIKDNYPHYTNQGLIFQYPSFVSNNIKKQRERSESEKENPSLMGRFLRFSASRASKNLEKDFPGYIEQVKKNVKENQ
jgi:hypothetical protein